MGKEIKMADTKVGWVGIGVMGRSMCGHLLKAGCTVSLHTRTREKAAELVAAGAAWCKSPREVAQKSDVVFSMVGFPSEVEEVFMGDDGILAGAHPGALVCDMSTSEPSLAIRIHQSGAARGVACLDAPVSGGDVGAREARLAIMVGGDKGAFDRALPLFQKMGETIALMGGPGAGQHTKVANQVAIAGTMIGTVEALLYARTAGLGMDAVIDIIGKGAAASWSLNNLGRRIAKGDFAPGFYIKHFVKDMGIALQEARRMKLAMPGLALVHQFYVSAQAQGLENLGTQGLFKVLAAMSSTYPADSGSGS
jgi:3-hydroxyisobutyrate dehydrogenase